MYTLSPLPNAAGLRLLFAATCIASQVAAAQESAYPAKPIRFIIPAAAGGIHDLTARAIGQKLHEAWGQQVVVDNRPGAAGILATELGARAPADGHTLLMIISGHTTNPSLYRKLPYDTVRDFAPVTQLVTFPLVLVVHPSLPARTVKELVALAKSRPGELNYASPGIGTSPHLAMELFRAMAGIRLTHVPYKGGPMGTTAILSGEVSLYFNSITTPLPHIRSGRLRALATTGKRRDATLTEVPTMQEAGISGYEVASWLGLVVPSGTPPGIQRRIHAEVARALRSPDVTRRLAQEGAEPVGNAPEEFAGFLASETRKWSEVVRLSGARAEQP